MDKLVLLQKCKSDFRECKTLTGGTRNHRFTDFVMISGFLLFFLVNLSMLFIFNVRVCLLLGVLAHEHRLNDV